jgi:hypothetical protein
MTLVKASIHTSVNLNRPTPLVTGIKPPMSKTLSIVTPLTEYEQMEKTPFFRELHESRVGPMTDSEWASYRLHLYTTQLLRKHFSAEYSESGEYSYYELFSNFTKHFKKEPLILVAWPNSKRTLDSEFIYVLNKDDRRVIEKVLKDMGDLPFPAWSTWGKW